MLQITVPATELWDDKKEIFVSTKEQTLRLEHSLVSVSKWEMKWHKPFLERKRKTWAESADYVRCMTLTQNVDPNVYACITSEHFKMIAEYIDDPMTATRISKGENQKRTQRKILTSEEIYWQMIALGIPFECEKWHLNRLFMLIDVCNAKNEPPKKMSQIEIMKQNAAINAVRKKKWKTRG